MRWMTLAHLAALAASFAILANCQHYDAEPVTPVAMGAKTESHIIQTAKPSPYIMLVVDRSNSMNETIVGGSTKLNSVKDKFAGDNGFLKSCPSAKYGLILFPAAAADDNRCVAGTVGQNVGAALDDVRQSINSVTSISGTPTAASLLAVMTDPKMSTPEAGIDRYVMLLTDGAPNCNSSLDSTTCRSTDRACTDPTCCLDDVATIAQVQALANQGIKTFIIGFGNETGNSSSLAYEVLNKAAQAGGLGKSQEPRFYQANSSADLEQALQVFCSIVTQTCSYQLSELPKASNLIEVAFVYTNQGNREEILSSPGDWSYDAAAQKVSITGTRCNEIESGPDGLKVEIRYVTPLQ